MSINRSKPHLLVLPEDDANRQLVNGFIRKSSINETVIQVLPVANGWKKVVDKFKTDHASSMKKFPQRRIVLVIDFDDYNQPDGLSFENRLNYIKSQISDELKEKVFVLGSRTSPEKLRSSMKKSFESIGESLAKDCSEDTNKTWGHELLKHNEEELKRMISSVKPFLFD